MEWTLRVNGREEPIRVRLGAGREPTGAFSGATVFRMSGGVSHDVRNVAIIELPAAILRKTRLCAGDRLQFSSKLLTHARAYEMEWGGRFRFTR